MWVLTFVASALACAGLVHEEGVLAESGASQAIFEIFEGEAEVSYRVIYDGDAADFGWIVPVPADVLSVDDGDATRFAALDQATAPEVWRPSDEASSGRGCGSANTKNDVLAGRANDGITVLDEGFTGTYDYVVVDASDADALSAWAADNGWSIAGVQADLQHYIDRGDRFVLLGLDPAQAQAVDVALPPITIRYASDALRFPSVMARSGETQRNTVFVVGESRAVLSEGWTLEDVSWLDGPGEAVDVFETALSELGAERTWARVWAGEAEGRFVTRLDLLADASLHDRDAVFGFDGGQDDQRLQISIVEGGGTAALLLPFGLLLGVARRRKALSGASSPGGSAASRR